MSAPETNVEKQKSRHNVPLFGMVFAIIWAAILLIGLLVWLSWNGNEPANDTPIDEEPSASASG